VIDKATVAHFPDPNSKLHLCRPMSPKTETNWADRTSKAILLIRDLVGWVFLSEGIQNFLFPDSLGVGRFMKIGIPWPQLMDSLRAIARAVLVPFMIHELFPSLTETASGSHPCCVVLSRR
jgi:hypothetical protein